MSSSVFYYEPFYDIERFFDEAFNSGRINAGNQVQRSAIEGAGVTRSIKPRMDLHEDVSNNTVTATFELPGLKKENIEIDVHNGRLTVSGESHLSSEYDQRGYAIRERRFGKFSRTLQLPQGVKEEEIKASMDQGVLTVTFPKLATEMAPMKFTIS